MNLSKLDNQVFAVHSYVKSDGDGWLYFANPERDSALVARVFGTEQ